MTLEEFRATLAFRDPPEGAGLALRALWQDAKGNWEAAHKIAQAQTGEDGAWAHAYLHRKEGDLSNASYWYERAGKAVPDLTLDQEWEAIVAALLPEVSNEKS